MEIKANAIIRVDALTSEIGSHILNASERGLLLAMPESRPVGTKISVTLHIEDPIYEISVSGIIVHIRPVEGADPRVAARAGILLTDAGPDWLALCRRLARMAGLSGR